MNYEQVERDFVSRTLKILEQYDTFVMPSVHDTETCEVTLLLNCLLGLVVVPFEHQKKHQKKAQYPIICDGDDVQITGLSTQWGLQDLQIEKFNIKGKSLPQEEITLRKIVAMVRHTMAHSQFGDGRDKNLPLGLSVMYQNSEYNPIESVIFEVNMLNQYKEDVDFKAIISVKGLRKFAVKLATTFLDELQGSHNPVNMI